ncbi:MAG TPA: UDP-N-acetylmuramoyl-tripeptide--D-alanyl-D-alanine ligase [Thermoanaerobaculia bacterium]|nr:UDP-N-acetylmuramoyl-tripeptide--D-alanyl-D-alanine ligase [Thermoanaerobaculia bacterium]
MTPRFTEAEVVRATGGSLARRGVSAAFEGISTDSRTIAPGSLFVALKGEHFDGHDFLSDARAKGAGGAVVRRGAAALPETDGEWSLVEVDDTLVALGRLARAHRSRFAVPIGAVAGSNGKTTTKEMAAAILRTRGEALATEGNLNNEVGVPLTLFRLTASHRSAVVEMGMSKPGELGRVTAMTRPSAGVVTLVAEEHLEFLKDLDGVAAAEGELFRGLPPDAVAVVNLDDARVVAEARKTRAKSRLTFGRAAGADVRLLSTERMGASAQRLVVGAGGEEFPVDLSFAGVHNAENATAAFALATALGFGPEACVQGLEAARPFLHRSRIVEAGRILILDDCYNANPSSMAAALRMLGSVAARRRPVAVLGDMLELGAAEEAEHRALGARAVEAAALLVFFGPRSAAAFEAARTAGPVTETAHFLEVEQLLAWLLPRLRERDAVLVKGSRGMKLERVVDALEARKAGPGAS